MFYTIKHITRFRYSAAVSQSVTELRVQPRDDGGQSAVRTQISTSPRARIQSYRDFNGNTIHHFDIPGRHTQMAITAESTVEVSAPPELPDSLEGGAWVELDRLAQQADCYDYLIPSRYTQPTPLLAELANELGVRRRTDPLTLLRDLSSAMFDAFEYAKDSTRVDSPIDDALRARAGVCQDFSHITIALLRQIGVPARYVSGYLYHGGGSRDRSAAGATHAWVEVLLPGLGWIGIDPTNDIWAGERHIRVALGRDYADVPPTRGVFSGRAEQLLEVAVRVAPTDAPPSEALPQPALGWVPPERTEDELSEQEQQQQQ